MTIHSCRRRRCRPFKPLFIAASTILLSFGGLLPRVYAEEPITIGLMADVTGNSASNGQACEKGFALAQRLSVNDGKVAGRSVKFLFEDNKADPASGVNAFSKLTTVDKVSAVISTRAQVVMALNPLSKREGVPLLATIGHPDFIPQNPYAFNFWTAAEVEGRALADKAVKDGFKRAAIVATEDQWTLSLASAFSGEFQRLRGKVVMNISYPPGETDFRSAAAGGRRLRPDVYFIDMVSGQAGTMMKALREHQQKQQFYSNLFGTFPEAIQVAGAENVEGLVIVTPDMNRPLFWQKITELFPGERPATTAYACYAALSCVLEAIKQNPRISSRKEMHNALAKVEAIGLLDEKLPVVDRQARYQLTFRAVKSGILQPLP